MQLQLLGAASIYKNQVLEPLPLARPAWLCLYLALRGDWVARDELACVFRPEDSEETARNALRLIFHRAKQFDWAKGLEVEAKRARFVVKTDVADFRLLIQNKNWLEALEIYKGGLLEGFAAPSLVALEAWLGFEREQLHDLWREAVLERVVELSAIRNYGVAISWLEKLLHIEPFCEVAIQHLMQCHLAGHNRQAAERVYQRFSSLLAEEFSLNPNAKTSAILESTKQVKEMVTVLPKSIMPLFGRTAELEQIRIWLIGTNRLVSIVGLGGTGKTRLALEAARLLSPEFTDGTVFIDGTAIGQANQLLSALAAALNLQSQPTQNFEQTLLVFLKEKAILLVLDNMEHLLETDGLIGRMLSSAEHLRVLVTTRIRLGMNDETILDLLGLPVPKNPLEIPNNQAVRLFLQIAGRLTKQNLEPDLVAKIVQKLEGLPLAIELAARWSRLLNLEQILAELEKSQLWLETDTTDVPERHRSLQAVLQSTWVQLTLREKQALEALSVFRSGASLDGLQAVGQTQLPTLLALINKGLIRKDDQNRFSCHEMIREFSAAQSNVLSHFQARHANYFAERCSHWGKALRQPKTLQEMDREGSNLNVAMMYWVTHQPDTLEQHLRLLADYWDVRGLAFIALNFLTSYSAQSGSILEGRTNFWHGTFLKLTNNYTKALQVLELSAQQLKHAECPEEAGRAFLQIGFIYFDQTNYVKTQEAVIQAQLCFQLDENRAECFNLLGGIAKRQLNYQLALTHYAQARSIHLKLNNAHGLGSILNNIANVHEVLQEDLAAFETYQQCLEIFTKLGHQRAIALLHSNLGFLATKLKRFEKAREHLSISLEIRKTIGDQAGEVTVLTNLAILGVAIKNAELVFQSLQAALSLALQLNFTSRALDAFKVLGEWYIESHPNLAGQILQTVFEHPNTHAETRPATKKLLEHLPIPNKPLPLDQWQSAFLKTSRV